ncbi:MAG: hypothetical protein WC002_03650 [Candidatus Muiribacteriota bacterium]
MKKELYNLCDGCLREIKCNDCKVFNSKDKMKIFKKLLRNF